MATKRIDTVIVLRHDNTTAWESADAYILQDGEVGIGYLTRDDGTKVVVAKVGSGEKPWSDLPQIEGVFEEDQILTYDFGRHITTNGYVNAGGKGMTTSEWLMDALSEIKNPTVNQPSASISASAYIEGSSNTATSAEMGSRITAIGWNGTFNTGSYKDAENSDTYGTVEDKTSNSTGLSATDVTWAISNNKDEQKASTEDGKFTFTSDQYITVGNESSIEYVRIYAKADLDATNARTPLNNVGKAYAAGKITDKEWTGLSAAVSVSGYRKPFWGYKLTAEAIANPAEKTSYTSAIIRGLGKSGISNGDLPTTFVVPAGTKQVFFAAKAGVKSSLTVKNVTKEPATGVACNKIANAVNVEGANNYTATAYDVWYINLDAAFTAETTLSLTWA